MHFACYRDEYVQSPKPVSTRRLARKWKVPYHRIAAQCRLESWVEQRREFQAKVKAKQEEEAVESLAEARSRWAKTYRVMQAVGLKGLGKLRPRTAGESARILDLGVKGEKLEREVQDDEETAEAMRDLVVKWEGGHDDT
jgi:predicted nucleic acid-binding Zn ribbon protein